MSQFPTLFSPITIGSMTIKNRSVVPAMGTSYTDLSCKVNQKLIDYHKEKAKGGFGLIIVEVTAVDQNGKTAPNTPGLWEDAQIEGFAQLADAVHEYGAKICVQLQHPGRQTITAFNGVQPMAPSPLACQKMQEIPRELTTAEVYELAEQFGQAALRAKQANLDAVEIHGAHGYLICEFMSAYSNRRLDEFGGSLENRMRFPKIILENVRKYVGKDFPVLFRISAEELSINGITLPEARAMAQMLQSYGVDALNVSAGNYSGEYFWSASDYPVAYMANLAEDVKKSVQIPVITVGKINSPYLAEEILSTGRADMIAFGRESIADPHFIEKVYRGKTEEIAPCINCHQGCTANLLIGQPLSCLVNPFVGREEELLIKPASEPKKIAVVGGGPAGLQAAWILAKRGHSVDLYEQSETLGGQFRAAAFPPGKADFIKPLQYYIIMGRKYGVRYHLNSEVSVETMNETHPEVIILATGSKPLLPPIKGIDDPNLLKAAEVLLGQSQTGRKVLIAGGGLVGVETADFLALYQRQITVMEMADNVAKDMNNISKTALMARMKNENVQFMTNAKINEFLTDGVVYEQNGEIKELHGFDTIVLALGSKSYNPLEDDLKKEGYNVHVIGDAFHAGKALEAIRQATELAVSI